MRMNTSRPRRSLSRNVAGIVAAGASIALLAACSGGTSTEEAGDSDAPKSFEGQTLVVNMPGGFLGELHQEYIYEPFEKEFGVTIETVEGLTADLLAKAQAQKNNPQMDVLFMANSGFAQGSAQDLWATMTEEKVPFLAEMGDDYRFEGDTYVSTYNGPVVLAYNPDLVTSVPTSWEDLWDPAYAGKAIIPDMNGCCGVLFLLQSAMDNGGGIDDIQPGFDAIQELKPNLITLFTSNSDAQTLYTDGAAALGVWSIDRAVAMMQSGASMDYVIPEEGAPLVLNSVAIVNGSPNQELAEVFVDFALRQVTKPEFYTQLASLPGLDEVEIPAEFKDVYPSEDEMARLWVPEWSKIAPEMPAWQDQWQREVVF